MFVTFVLQLFVSGFVLKKIGSTRSMLFLPGILCAVFAVLSVMGFAGGGENAAVGSPASRFLFWSIVLGMGMRVAFFDSFFSPNFQTFFSSLPQEIRGRGKLSIEGVVKPAAIISAGIWLIFIVPHLTFAVNMAVLFFLSVGVVVQTFRIRSKYAQSLTAYLTGFKTKKMPALFNLVNIPDSENFLAILGTILEKEEFEIKKFIIDILTDMNCSESIEVLVDYSGRCDSKTRASIVSALARLNREDCKYVFVRMLGDPDDRVVANSISALSTYKDFETQEGLEAFLHHRNNRVKANAVIVEWSRMKGTRNRHNLSELLAEMLFSKEPLNSASALYAMGEIRSEHFLAIIKKFVEERSDSIARSRPIHLQLVMALAKLQCEDSFDMILGLTGDTNSKAHSDHCRAVELLVRNGYPLRRCLERLASEHYIRRGIILNALFNVGVQLSKSDDDALESVADSEAASVYSDWLSLCILDTKSALKEVALLRTAVYESCILEKTRNLISIAALLDKTGQIGSIIQRLRHQNRHVRARAFEVLDNVGNIRVNRMLISLLDSDDAGKHGRDATVSFKQRSKPLFETVSAYLSSNSEWLRTCVLYAGQSLFENTGENRWRNLSGKGLGEATDKTIAGLDP
jgi:HEAT repeat protein